MGKVVVGVVFDSNPKVYYFNPADMEFKPSDKVIVETSRGLECGTVSFGNKVMPEDSIHGELKPVLRLATEEDVKKHEENLADKSKVLKSTVERVREHKLDMKVVGAEYTFDKSKLIIYFTAEARVDFRELVKVLASEFKTRIELRQIYERDSVKMYGALAPCGMECCCARFLKDYEKTSIKMAKNQDLSLNPTAISGFCGKLMCCLKFENDHYEKVALKLPKVGSFVNTPMGRGKVVGTATLKERVKVRFYQEDEDGSSKEHEFDVDEITQVREQSDTVKEKKENKVLEEPRDNDINKSEKNNQNFKNMKKGDRKGKKKGKAQNQKKK